MRRHIQLALALALSLPVPAIAQAPLLIDPGKVPMTLKGAWIHHRTGDRNDIVIRIESMQPDGSFTGKLDFHNTNPQSACKVIGGTITEGRVTDRLLRVRAEAINPNACPNFGLTFRSGGERYLEGQTKFGDKTWIDAPK